MYESQLSMKIRQRAARLKHRIHEVTRNHNLLSQEILTILCKTAMSGL
jgi:hypothetical protein